MKFEKGISGNRKGRPRGALAKRTAIVQGFADVIVSGGIPKFKKEMASLKGKQYVDAFLALLEYSVPKKQRVEHSGADGGAIEVRQVFRIGDIDIEL
jgi:hypothetical protein